MLNIGTIVTSVMLMSNIATNTIYLRKNEVLPQLYVPLVMPVYQASKYFRLYCGFRHPSQVKYDYANQSLFLTLGIALILSVILIILVFLVSAV